MEEQNDQDNGIPAFDIAAIIPQSNEEIPVFKEGTLPIVQSGQPWNQATSSIPESISGVKAEQQPIKDDTNAHLVQIIEELRNQVYSLTAKVEGQQTRIQRAESADDGGGESGFPWMYYKRAQRGPAAGWVTIGPGGSASPGGNRRDVGSYSLYTYKGWKPLTEYGVIAPPQASALVGAEYRQLLQNGGVREFPVAQVLAYKWHINPPISGLIFPQVEEVRNQINNFVCDECDFDIWFLEDDRETARSCFQHLTRIHNYPRREASLTLEAQGIKTVAPFAVRAAHDVPEVSAAEKVVYAGLDNQE